MLIRSHGLALWNLAIAPLTPLALAVLALVAVVGCGSHHAGVVTSDAAVDRGGDGAVDRGDGASTAVDVSGDGGGGGDGGIAPADGATADAPDARADNRPGADGATGPDTPTGSDAAGVADGGVGAGCNAVTLGAPVTFVCVAGDAGAPAAPMGGAIVPGTYQLTAATIYGSCADGISATQTLVITPTTLQAVADDPVFGLQRLNAAYTVSGTDMMQTDTCPNTDTRTVGFTATAATLTVFSVSSGTTTVGVLTRQ